LCFRKNRTILHGGVIASILLVVAAALVALFHTYRQAESQAAVATQNLATSIEQTFEGRLDEIDIALSTCADEIGRQYLAGNPDERSITRFLLRQQDRLNISIAVWGTNPGGDIIYGSDLRTPPISIADRDYFIRLRDDANAGLVMSAPTIGRVVPKWVWHFARRVNKPDGSFGGVVLGSLYVDQIESMLSKINIGPGGSISLRGADMGLIARYRFDGPNTIPVGDRRLSKPFSESHKANPEEGTFVSGATSIDGVNRTISYRHSAKYGFTVNVGIARQVTLTNWYRQAGTIFVLVAAFIVGAVVFQRTISRAWRQQEQDVKALDASRESLREAQKIANLGHYFYDLTADRWTSSDILDDIFGIGEDFPRDRSHWLGLVAAEARAEMRLYLDTIAAQGLPFDREYPIERPSDGQIRWVHGLGEFRRDATGAPVVLVGTIQDITERRRTEQLLAENESRWREVFNAVGDAIFIHEADSGKIVEVNHRMCEMYGCSHDEALHATFADFNAAMPPYAYADAIAWMRKAIDEGPQTFEWLARRLDGHLFWVEVRLRFAQIGEAKRLLAIVHDISQRKRVAEALEASEARYRTAFNTSPDAVTINRLSDGSYVDVNRGFVELTGYERVEVVGRTSLDIGIWFEPRERQTMIDILRQKSYCRDFETRFRIKNGDVVWGLMSASQVEIDGVPCILAVTRDISAIKLAEDEIRNLAFYDSLTRLPNRRLLMDRLSQALIASARSKRKGGLMFVDLDNFKTLNDAFGHAEGDNLLLQVAHRLTASVREGDTVARLGGDEFVVMLENLSEDYHEAAAQIRLVGEKILAALDQPYDLSWQQHHSTASIGAALFEEDRESVDDLLKRADIAMYQAKAAGRNTLRFFDPDLQAEVKARAALEADMRLALKEGQFFLCYQPQVDDAGRVTGAEALARWRHPARGLVSPGEFIPLAEETGLILALGRWVLESACAQIVAWGNHAGTAGLSVAVNVSARQFRQADFVEEVLEVIDRTGVDPRRLKLELTESMLLDDLPDIIDKMTALKARGVGFSLDDFGTGYSSLSYLKRLPLSQLKIDQSFVRDVLTDSHGAAIARTIVALAQSLDLSVIAEGVETEAQRAFLSSHGCHAFQGYLFGRPGTAEEFERRLVGVA